MPGVRASTGCPQAISIDALAQGLGLERGRELVAHRLGLLQNGIARALDAGWAPDEITRVIRRRVSATAASFVADPLSEVVRHRHQAGGPDSAPWQAKSGRKLEPAYPSWRSDLSSAIAAFAFIVHLPALPELDGTRSRTTTARSPNDERLFTRIRGLLSKAESSDFVEEADAFMAKAQELMTRYCIDRTMLDANAEGGDASAGRDAARVARGAISRSESAPTRQGCECKPMPGCCRSGFRILHPGRRGRRPRRNGPPLYILARAGHAAPHDSRSRSDGGQAFPEVVVPPIFPRGICGEDRCSSARSKRDSDDAADDALGNRLLPVLARRHEKLDAAVGLFGELKELKSPARISQDGSPVRRRLIWLSSTFRRNFPSRAAF